MKQIKFGVAEDRYGVPEHNAFMYVTQCPYTKSEIIASWNVASTLQELLGAMLAIDVAGGGFPFYNPGYYTGDSSLEALDDYEIIRQFVPYSAQFAGSLTNSYIKFCDTDGNGFYCFYTTGIGFVLNNSNIQLISSAYFSQLGTHARGTINYANGSAIFTTSDGYVGVYNASLNRNNSSLKWFSLNTSTTIITWLEGLPDVSTDPYDPDGPSEPGGGDGEFDDPTEPVPIPDPPSISVADTGFVTLFNPSLSELKSLANYMWSDLFSVDSFKKIFADPMQAVLGLSIVPVNVPSAGSREVVVGNISTGVSMTVAAKQFVTVDCGSITVKKHWGAYLDYDPYTKSFIYLPYIGMHPVSTDDIMGRVIHIKYNVDILSGACTAFIESGGVVLYQFIGQVSSCIPITGDNFSSVINGVLGIAGSVGAMVATGGFAAPAAAAEAGLGTAYTAGHFISAGAAIGQDVMNMKPSIEKSGAMSGTGGIMGVQNPYLIMLRPNAAIPGGQNQFLGYPAHITAKLDDLTGYTEVEMIHLENIPCTEKEQEEILHYLAGGVIL